MNFEQFDPDIKNAAYVGLGAGIGYIGKQFWNFVTRKNCTECKMIEAVMQEVTVIKRVVIKVAEKNGVVVDDYEDMIK